MSNSGKVWDIREAYKLRRANNWSRGSRGLFMGGQTPTATSTIDFIDLNHSGNAVDFGDLATTSSGVGTQSSNSIRALRSINGSTNIDYVTIATKGNAADFGDMIDSYGADSAVATDTRACYVGGYSTPTFSPGWNINRIQYVNLPTLGNMADFGDLTQGRANQASGANSTRGIFSGGYNGGAVNNTDYITVASTGNAIDFGDADVTSWAALAANGDVRFFSAGGQPSATGIGYFTYATLGNQNDWGDLPVKGAQGAGSASLTRGIFQMGEAASPVGGQSNRLESISMQTSGNSSDFGDLTVGRQDNYGVAAQGHGGLLSAFEPRSSVTYMPGSGKVLMLGGNRAGGDRNTIDTYNINTLGNASDFGDMLSTIDKNASCASTIKAISFGGETPAGNYQNVIQDVFFQSEGNASDFGDLVTGGISGSGCNSVTRGISQTGYVSPGATSNEITYITMASSGNSTDFGNLTSARLHATSFASSTRGVFFGGKTPTTVNTIDYITIASTGDATDFGDAVEAISKSGGLSSGVRGVAGGGDAPTDTDRIQYVTIASTGNATDFGDLLSALDEVEGAANPVRGCFMGGGSGSYVNTIQYITIASTGNAIDFGDMTEGSSGFTANSDSNGGLQG